jgi:diadenosine tetraphosphate (Ap4A) HIT family hydrolase
LSSADDLRGAPKGEPGVGLDCFICSKHRLGDRAQGGVLYRDALVYAGHVATGAEGAYRGHLVAEPLRHVEGVGLLTDEEAARLGWLTNRLGGALRTALGADHVYSFVLGGAPHTTRTPAHLHVHVVPRYAGTPPEYRGPTSVSRWPEAPRVCESELRALVQRLRTVLMDMERSS